MTAASLMLRPGKAAVILGGQFGSEAKGAAAAWVAAELGKAGRAFEIVTTNAGAQAGHTSIHNGNKRVVFHLPTAPLISSDFRRDSKVYLNAGSIIDPGVLVQELKEFQDCGGPPLREQFFIHPMAAVITDDCRMAENAPGSAQTMIASTRKGVGEALARKVLRSGLPAYQHPKLAPYCRKVDLNASLGWGASVLVEVPQGLGLSLNGPFYPHCTSRDCTIQQAMNDAAIHPAFMGTTMLVLRTFPIRVGNITEEIVNPPYGRHASEANRVTLGSSGDGYPDQREMTWEELGQPPEITTVTKRIRRVFSWSQFQTVDAIRATRPDIVFLSHVDYLNNQEHKLDWYVDSIRNAAKQVGIPAPRIIGTTGPTTADAFEVD